MPEWLWRGCWIKCPALLDLLCFALWSLTARNHNNLMSETQSCIMAISYNKNQKKKEVSDLDFSVSWKYFEFPICKWLTISMFFLGFTMQVLWLVHNMLCDCGSDALKYLVKCPRKSKLFTGVLQKVRLHHGKYYTYYLFSEVPTTASIRKRTLS